MKRLLLKITDSYTAKCRHCFDRCVPGKSSPMSAEEIDRCIREADPTECVIVTGGEASIHPELVIHAVKTCTSLGKVSWLNTNGFWGGKQDFATQYAQDLKAAGLARANISIDGLHQEYVPFSAALGALHALRDAGIGKIEAFVTLIDRKHQNRWDQETERLIPLLQQEPGIKLTIRDNGVGFLGRACTELAEQAPSFTFEEALADKEYHLCQFENESGTIGDVCSLSFYLVNPDCTVELCGMRFPKNLRDARFAEIVSRANVESHPVTAEFQRNGVEGLIKMAMNHGFSPRKSYTSRCHVCQDAQQTLRKFFPEVFTSSPLRSR